MAAWGADYAVNNETGPVFLAALALMAHTSRGILPAVMAVEAGYTILVAKASKAKPKWYLVLRFDPMSTYLK